HTRDKVQFGQGHVSKVTAISLFDRGSATAVDAISAGRIGKLWGLADIRIGDEIDVPHSAHEHSGHELSAHEHSGRDHRHRLRHQFAPPTLETVVVPRRAADKGALHVA